MSEGRTDWREKARRLSERFPLGALHPEVRRWLAAYPESWHAGVACSGGADSLCLLLLLWAHFAERRKDFVVLHFDHRLRGEASRQDAAFVEEVARALELEARLGTWERSEGEPVSEETARAARFEFFYREMGRGVRGEGRGEMLFLGHQRDDIVESQLMRLSRGSGTGGLAAPRPVHEFSGGRVHLRPLLTLAGGDVRCALGDLGIPFRVDASNDAPGFYRNRIRLEVLPVWRKHSPFDVSAGAAASRELLEEDDEALQLWLRELMPAPAPGQPLDLRPLGGKPNALVRRALHEWLRAEGLADNISRAAFDQMLEAARVGEPIKMSAGAGAFLELDVDRMLRKATPPGLPSPVFEKPWPLPPNGVLLLPGGRNLQARVFPLDSATRAQILAGRVESRAEAFAAWTGEPLWVRHWQPGDRFRPLGAPGSRKLQDMFVDRKIPEAERYLLPVVVAGRRILWTPSLSPAEVFKITSVTKVVVRLTYDWGKAV